ncbi:S-methyl-5-thioribose-1-phosphate isomerase [Ruminiclostridium cellulolyticum]|uniref:Methylthioribose-1-phosphate isomerase n=1 Tax=Ruminiclostridium cellulolyticum (strain ATCC 35319 / DSM 5812 / JCM 6584 / H10) TaxID=394503 RepID=B8I0S0_RUMCH|nr:S-methyl-5-thioribose-1-phosphate isomerase [Ruminiclostridium cellulolyticum]ACL75645.1 translation initiation factor, aIF-2BI family [Ruminiclostridium cellulolyticum H10]
MTDIAKNVYNIETVILDDTHSELIILDQTLLPAETVFLKLKTQEEIWEAIYKLRVRGAPAIGIAAAYGIYLGAKASKATDYDGFYSEIIKLKEYLASSRPTAVNLFWALDRMDECVKRNKEKTVNDIKFDLLKESQNIKQEDIWVCRSIGEYGLTLLKPGMGILTHCNAGQLATSKYGTALAPIYVGHEKGYNLKVFADETRPLLQGARLTAYELNKAGVDVTLICDNMASAVMKNGWVQAVFVGCDRVAANGDTANKIGTSGVAILAKNYNIPFYVCAPTSTIDLSCASGKDICIEERKPEEVTEMWYEKRMAPKDIKVFNPAFDVTDEKFITGIITEYGIVKAPYSESLKEIFKRKRGTVQW